MKTYPIHNRQIKQLNKGKKFNKGSKYAFIQKLTDIKIIIGRDEFGRISNYLFNYLQDNFKISQNPD